MAKNILQDIVPPEKRSIRNIPLPQRRKTDSVGVDMPTEMVQPERRAPIQTTPVDVIPPKKQPPVELKKEVIEPKIYPYNDGAVKKTHFGSKKVIFGSIGVAVVIMAIAVMSLFGGATISVTPVEATGVLTPNTKLSASKNPTEGGLPFQIVTLTKTSSKDVSATGEEQVERKASGKIIIYNNFDSNNQRLIKNTRFETPEGLIYRINESVVVPGRKSENGALVPGQIEVTVYADEPGEKYNIGKKDFTIPGFKGDPRFSEIYARSKTDMTGGFVGIERKISDSDKAAARAELQAALTQDLQKDVVSQVPEDFVMFNNAYSVTFKELPPGSGNGSTVAINEEATLTGILFENTALAAYVAETLDLSVVSYDSRIVNVNEIAFTLDNKEAFTELTENITFTLDGAPKFVAEFNPNSLVEKLVSQPKSSLNQILTEYPQIETAESVVRPFWKRTFPDNADDITVKVVGSK